MSIIAKSTRIDMEKWFMGQPAHFRRALNNLVDEMIRIIPDGLKPNRVRSEIQLVFIRKSFELFSQPESVHV